MKEYLETLREKLREAKDLGDFLYELASIAELNEPFGIYCEWELDLEEEAIYIYDKEEESVKILRAEFVCYLSTLCWHYFISKDFEEVKDKLQELPKMSGPGVALLVDGGASLFKAATEMDLSEPLKNSR